MPSRPTVVPLPRSHRRIVFWSFLVIFLVSLPALWFYTTGYRFEWDGMARNIVGVGGLYISTDSQNVTFFVDETPVTDFRIFRQASYIQNLVEGKHSVHVQSEGLQTWTKDLPVQSYIVTEAFAFTLPTIPQIRVISEYLTSTGTSVIRNATSTALFPFASTTNTFIATTTRATTTLTLNSEHTYVADLFALPATSTSLISRLSDRVERQFVPVATTTVIATTTKEWQNVRLYKNSEGEVEVTWRGSERERPYYYCIEDVTASTTPDLFGTHVYDDMIREQIESARASTAEAAMENIEGTRVCRDSIRIDRKFQHVEWFDFYPSSTELVLMLLEDGLYVVEVDDRSWQNIQLLYPGTDLKAVLDGGRIYVEDRGYYVEVFTELQL